MKTKHGFIGAALIGFAAGIVRILQYIWTIDSEGYYTGGPLSDFLGGLLVGLLVSGFAWSILCGAMQKKIQVSFSRLFGKSKPARILFLLIAISILADGIYRLVTAAGMGAILVGLFCLAGALNWLLLAKNGELPALLGLLPILHLGGVIIDYFWHTYKYIQVSEYSVGILGLCALVHFILLLMKTLSGADCTKGRLASSGCCLLVFGFAALMTPLAGGFRFELLILAIQGLLFSLLAALTLIWLPVVKAPIAKLADAPDPSTLNEYISDIEIKEDEEDEL